MHRTYGSACIWTYAADTITAAKEKNPPLHHWRSRIDGRIYIIA